MQIEKTEHIGQVLLKHIQVDRPDAPVYSDGSVEDELYKGFKSRPDYGTVAKKRKYTSWAHEYHLSPVRENLLKWYRFDPDGSALEVGAGCGALTGMLCCKLRKVTALEYSYKRARVTAQKHCNYSNLEVVVGGLQDFETEERFDYIVVIGVLEYAGTFYSGENPYLAFLIKLGEMLNPGGELILAIENKIGLKYVCGAPEDHTGRIFESIYGYPYCTKVRTFSRKELTHLLHTAGYSGLDWYYPWPDYKLPIEVLSEKVVPKETDSIWSLFPAQARGTHRKEILSERRLGKTLARAGLFKEFANSFLVVARRQDETASSWCLRFKSATMQRKAEFRTNTQIWQNGQGRWVLKVADNEKSVGFLEKIAKRETLAKEFFGDTAEVVTGRLEGSRLRYPYLPFATLEDRIATAMEDGTKDFGASLVKDYVRFLQSLPQRECVPRRFMNKFGISSAEIAKPLKCLRCGPVDCIPRNIMIDEQKWYIIDNEWTYEFAMPLDLLTYRGILTLVFDLQSQIQTAVSEDRPVTLFFGYGRNRHYLPVSWLEVLDVLEIPFRSLARWSALFENDTLLGRRFPIRVRLTSKPRVYSKVENTDIQPQAGSLRKIRRALAALVRRSRALRDRLLRWYSVRLLGSFRSR
jgi:SAM-dependent methyltransferase